MGERVTAASGAESSALADARVSAVVNDLGIWWLFYKVL